MKRIPGIFAVVVMVMLAGCSARTPAATSVPATAALPPGPTQRLVTATPPAPPSITSPATAVTATSAPITGETPPSAPSSPTVTIASGSQGASSGTLPADYLDDRSTPSGLIRSLFNAINRKEYLRAYSYWQNPASNPNVGTFDQFQKGYQDTASVQATLGPISGDAGAGQFYYSVPVVLKAQTTGGQTQTFAGCYILHLANPGIQAAPPFQPMSIKSATVRQADNSADPNSLLNGACPVEGNPAGPVPTTDSNTIAASNYLDARSTPVEVLRSLFNAVNRKEYARAYSYWQNPAVPFQQFQQGYQNTASVEVIFGMPVGDIGAGQIRYRVPVTLRSQTTGGQTQIFSGCYQLHLSQPAIQATPPFQPLGIEAALVKPAANDADAANQMSTICANMP